MPLLLPFITVDVPGLLEGAHEGHGLGHAFLRHISRCRVLLHLLDGTSPDPIGDYKAIQLELELFNPALVEKPQVGPFCCASVPIVSLVVTTRVSHLTFANACISHVM